MMRSKKDRARHLFNTEQGAREVFEESKKTHPKEGVTPNVVS